MIRGRGARTAGIVLAVVGLIVGASSFVWKAVGVPALVRFPTDLDVRPVYEGQFIQYLDPSNAAPLATPTQVPLNVDRHIKALGAKSSKKLVELQETITFKAGDSISSTQQHRYVIDRRKMVNVKSPDAYAFTPDNMVDRSGSFRLAFPFDTKPTDTFKVYKNEIGTTYSIAADPAKPTDKLEGLDVVRFVAASDWKPVTDTYLKELDKIVPPGLPRELTITQLDPLLKSFGIDVEKTVTAMVGAGLGADQLKTLLEMAKQPIKLSYVDRFTGGDAVERYTGAIVAVTSVDETIGAVPDPAALPPLVAILKQYQQVPEVQAALAGLEKLGAEPIKAFENKFAQTAASVKDIADQVRDQHDKRRLAEHTLPTLLLLSGIALLVIGVALAVTGHLRVGRSRRALATTVGEPVAGE